VNVNGNRNCSTNAKCEMRKVLWVHNRKLAQLNRGRNGVVRWCIYDALETSAMSLGICSLIHTQILLTAYVCVSVAALQTFAKTIQAQTIDTNYMEQKYLHRKNNSGPFNVILLKNYFLVFKNFRHP